MSTVESTGGPTDGPGPRPPRSRLRTVVQGAFGLGLAAFLLARFGLDADAAARVWFNKPASELLPEESAVLTAMLPAPRKRNPLLLPARKLVGAAGADDGDRARRQQRLAQRRHVGAASTRSRAGLVRGTHGGRTTSAE